MNMVLIESGQEDCTVTIGYLSHATRGMSHNERQRALRTQSTHRHPIVLEEHTSLHTGGGGALVLHSAGTSVALCGH